MKKMGKVWRAHQSEQVCLTYFISKHHSVCIYSVLLISAWANNLRYILMWLGRYSFCCQLGWLKVKCKKTPTNVNFLFCRNMHNWVHTQTLHVTAKFDYFDKSNWLLASFVYNTLYRVSSCFVIVQKCLKRKHSPKHVEIFPLNHNSFT